MTSKERLFSVLAGKQPDRIPNLNIIMQYAAREIGVPYSLYCKQHEKLVEGNIVCAEKYGLDCVTTMSDPMKEASAFGAEVIFPEDGVPYGKKKLLADESALLGLKVTSPCDSERMSQSVLAIERYKRLLGDDVEERNRCAVAWSSWEGETVSVQGPSGKPDKFAEPEFAVAFARIENWYFTNGGFFDSDDWILKNVDRMRHIPCWIAQGRFDVVTPISGAWALHRAWPEARLDIVGDAGHASSEPGIVDSLVRATDWAVVV